MKLAQEVASWSKDPSTQCGAVIVDHDRHIVGTGYNGFPMHIPDCPAILNNREAKYKLVIHAERNAIDNSRGSVADCILYVTHPCCVDCAQYIIDSGIRTVAMKYDPVFAQRWNSEEALNKFTNAGVTILKL